MMKTVKDLAADDSGLGTVGGEKADLVWEEACENLDEDIVEFAARLPVSETHVYHVLDELPPEAFGL